MSGFKVNGIDLDSIYIVESNNDTRSTGYKLSNGDDIINRYRIRASNIPQGDSTGYTISDGKDLSYFFIDKTNTSAEATITITASAGEPVIPHSVMHYISGYPYDIANGAILQFTIENVNFGQQLEIQKIYGGNGGRGSSSRYGSRGGHSYAVSLDGTLLAVAGAGGGCGAGNGQIGASAYYNGLTEPSDYHVDYNPNGTTNWGAGMTIGGYVVGSDRYWYGLNAKHWYVPGGDGGSHEDVQSGIYHATNASIQRKSGWDFKTTYSFKDTHYGYSGKGGYLHGGDGGPSFATGSHTDRDRSSGGGGGGAGYYGGGGAAGNLTLDGRRGSPGGGSGSSYLNESYCTFVSLAKNATFNNENVVVNYVYTVSGQANNTRETITVNNDNVDENGLYVKTF